ncbi:septal ring lytic transglycosylase RlpA family protein [Desulfosarcina sp. OttesenSCG-928-G10]|nr:septal ring lytic transglycosylase RlpA family protein [Desulfosarcina sp. OttesenSCG-928-G10]
MYQKNDSWSGFRHGMPLVLCGILILLCTACGGSKTASSKPVSTTPGSSTTAAIPKPYRVDGQWYSPISDSSGFSQKGIASWYGSKFHGRKTSSGEKYDMHAMTAAHKTLPFGTWVTVKRLDTGKSAVVRVNDRGPFVHGRIIDLSYAGAKAIDMVGPGTAKVEVVALGAQKQTPTGKTYVPVDYYHGTFTFQVGAFSSLQNAERLRDRLSSQSFSNAHVVSYDRGDMILYRVRVGLCTDLIAAEQYERKLIHAGYPDIFIVAE